MTELVTPKKRGRPVAFEYAVALEQAMLTFWKYGYEGTSMQALMSAMQMNKASIYAAFGSKEALFERVLDHYVAGPASFIPEALKQPTAYQVVQVFLMGALQSLTASNTPAGCLVMQSALVCSESSQAIQQRLFSLRRELEQRLQARFEQAQLAHDLTAESDPKALAKLVSTVHQGMSVQARTGATVQELQVVVEMVLALMLEYSTQSGAPAAKVST